MKKIFYLLFLLLFPLRVFADEFPPLYSQNAILYDISNDEILYEKNSDEIINIASLTKIVTTISAIQNIPDLQKTVTITKEMLDEIPSDASTAGLKEGDILTYEDLLYASMLPSGADATTALAYGISASTKDFVILMNNLVNTLNLEHTNFINVTGYDAKGQYSSPKDVLEILKYALQNDLFRKVFTTKKYLLTNGLEVETTLNYYNRNNTYDVSNIIGSKTGFTSKAGVCMASLINVKDKELILLTFNAPKSYVNLYNVIDAVNIINYLDYNYQNNYLFRKGDVILNLPVKDSKVKLYPVKLKNDYVIFTNEIDPSKIKIDYDGLKELSYKNNVGSKIGTLKITYEDKVFIEDVYLEYPLVITTFNYLKANIIFIIPIILIISILIIKHFKKSKKIKNI